MGKRQFTTPLMIENDVESELERIPLRKDAGKGEEFDEAWLKGILFKHPKLLPISEIERAFDDLIPLAREVRTESGLIDIVFISPEGFITLVETKLWRNPEARRTVVAQILDYAKDVSKWNYEAFANAVSLANPELPDLPSLAKEYGDGEFDEAEFIDAITENLVRGRFLLLIVGDGIRKGVEELVEVFQRGPGLEFTFGLVEIGLYRVKRNQNDPLIVVPRIVARTKEVRRAVVKVENSTKWREVVSVEAPKEEEEAESPKSITEEEILRRIRKADSKEAEEFAKWVLREAPKHGVETESIKVGFSFTYIDAKDDKIKFGWFRDDGRYEIKYLHKSVDKAKLPLDIANTYIAKVVSFHPEAEAEGDPSKPGKYRIKGKDGKPPKFILLEPKKDEWFAAMDEAIRQIDEYVGMD